MLVCWRDPGSERVGEWGDKEGEKATLRAARPEEDETDPRVDSRYLALTALVTGAICLPGCGQRSQSTESDAVFRDASVEVGLKHVDPGGLTEARPIPEIVGTGGGFIDFDNDGDLDIFLTEHMDLGEKGGAAGDYRGYRLFRNQMVDGDAQSTALSFVEVSEGSGLVAGEWGVGVATADVDNDGLVDLYVTHLGRNQLFRNLGEGRFEDISATAGISGGDFSTSALFVDFDGDDLLDLFVTNYVRYDTENPKLCQSPAGHRDYCAPDSFSPAADRVYRNLGGGGFKEMSTQIGVNRSRGPGLGVVAADFTGDGLLEIYVANDLTANHLWSAAGWDPWKDNALMAGVALNMNGLAEASMGVQAADLDNDGDQDLFMTHLQNETNTIYRNDGMGYFNDVSIGSALGNPSRGFTGFGTAIIDYDNDGWLDVAVANGAVIEQRAQADSGDPAPYHQPNQLFRNRGDGRFEDVSLSESALRQSHISRAMIPGDVDNDGDMDLLITNIGGPTRLLINQVGQSAHWIGFRVMNRHGADALGASIAVLTAGGDRRQRRVSLGGSYLSAHDGRALFGLGQSGSIQSVTVNWPDGKSRTWVNPNIDRYHVLNYPN